MDIYSIGLQKVCFSANYRRGYDSENYCLRKKWSGIIYKVIIIANYPEQVLLSI